MIQLQNKRAIEIIFIDSGERKKREERVSRNDE